MIYSGTVFQLLSLHIVMMASQGSLVVAVGLVSMRVVIYAFDPVEGANKVRVVQTCVKVGLVM